jgi:hypothetical protein
LKNYTRVRLITDKYKDKGAAKGDKGAVIEVFENTNINNQYLLEIFDYINGVTKTIIVVSEDDIEQIE